MALKEMTQYFFAAVHYNSFRLGIYHIMQWSNLPDNVDRHFIKGEHAVRLKTGYANAVSGDNGLESLYMLNGMSIRGII